MIDVSATPKLTGVEITGDSYDFDFLYNALHTVVGTEEEYLDYYQARLHVLGLCYDLRHANMGHRALFFRDHSIDSDTLKWRDMMAQEQNLYISFNIYYPELLFVSMALDQFIDLYKKKITYPNWDSNITIIRTFQSQIIQSLEEIMPKRRLTSMLGHMSKCKTLKGYFTQYLDMLNIRYFGWDKEERLKNISIIAKRLAEQGKEYQEEKKKIIVVANEEGVPASEIQYHMEYPDIHELEW